MVKIVQKEAYTAFDGKEFPTAAEAEIYEKSSPISKLEGLTMEALFAGVNYADKDIADALEKAGAAAARNRKLAGDKRARGGQKKTEG